MPILFHNYLKLSLNKTITSYSFHHLFHRQFHLTRPRFILIRSLAASSSNNKLIIKRIAGKNDSYSLPYFYQQNLPYGRYAYDEYASEEDSDHEPSNNLVRIITLWPNDID